MALSIAEVLRDVEKAKTREEKREVLKKNESWSLRALLQQNFHIKQLSISLKLK